MLLVLAHLQKAPAASKRLLQDHESVCLHRSLRFSLHLALKLVLVEFAAFGAVFPTLNLGFYELSALNSRVCHMCGVLGSPSSCPSFSSS